MSGKIQLSGYSLTVEWAAGGRPAEVQFLLPRLKMNLHYKVWNLERFRRYAQKMDQPRDRLHHTFTQVEARTFFETARLIVGNNKRVKFHKLPYVLALNQEGKTVDYDYLVKVFTDNINQILVIKIKTDHYPINLTKEYFRKMVPVQDMHYIINFIFGRV